MQEKVPRARAPSAMSAEPSRAASVAAGGLVTAHHFFSNSDRGVETRSSQAPGRSRLWHRLVLEGTGLSDTVTSESGVPGDVWVLCTMAGPAPAM